MSVAVEEQETVVQLSRDCCTMQIWTSDTTCMTKLDKIYPSVSTYDAEGKVTAKTYAVNKKLLTFRSDPSIKPNYKPRREISKANLDKMVSARR